ncbi:MAG: DUF2934 domain-containing protein [Candidatus Omnitrophica bacterium]|nr:DUF2934 domain-containing protein [Candidatus Omnitrophota bacterium]
MTKKASISVSHESSGMPRDLYDRIQTCAHALYTARGCFPGHELEDWLKAEKIVLVEYFPERDRSCRSR